MCGSVRCRPFWAAAGDAGAGISGTVQHIRGRFRHLQGGCRLAETPIGWLTERTAMARALISSGQMSDGATAAQNYATILYNQSDELYERKRYQESVPFAVESAWESMKGIELMSHHCCSRPMAKKYWEAVKNHRYEFACIGGFDMEAIAKEVGVRRDRNMEMEGMYGTRTKLYADDIVEFFEHLNTIKPRLEMFRTGCICSDWGEEIRAWQVFSVLSEAKKEEIASYVLENARASLSILDITVELYG